MKRPLVWTFCAVLMALGASWLVALLWRVTTLDLVPLFARYVLAAAILGGTLARAFDRRRHAMLLAAIAMTTWISLQLVLHLTDATPPRWILPFEALAHYGLAALLAIPTALVTASLHLRGRPDHPLLWVWISGLVVLGAIGMPLLLLRHIEPLAAIVAVCAPFLGGAVVQVLAPYRAIWTCGSGTVIFTLLIIDSGNFDASDIFGAVIGIGLCVLFGAAGARLAWYMFRGDDPRTAPPRVELPTATI